MATQTTLFPARDAPVVERDPLKTPVRGDVFHIGDADLRVDVLKAEGIVFEGDALAVSWGAWSTISETATVVDRGTDPCPNPDREHIGKPAHIKKLGRCYNRYRCLACGRTYDVDSSD